MQAPRYDLKDLLTRILKGHPVGKQEIIYLLRLTDPEKIDRVFSAARKIRTRHFGKKVFLYGFLYFSTFCRNDCRFCQYRQSNKTIARYRKNPSQIIAAATEMADAGVHLIDLTMGEDPETYNSSGSEFETFITMLKTVQSNIDLPIMVSPGTLPDNILNELAKAGITWYALYQETHNPTLYKSLRQGQSFEKRLAKKRLAKRLGMLVEEGILTGVGETFQDLADSIIWMKNFNVDQARVMTFVPQKDTPMHATRPRTSRMELLTIAVMRLVLRDCLIPASLDVNGLSGLEARLNAGANVVTSIVPPQKGLAGVANQSLDIEESRRTLDRVLPVVRNCSLEPATIKAYKTWTASRQHALAGSRDDEDRLVC